MEYFLDSSKVPKPWLKVQHAMRMWFLLQTMMNPNLTELHDCLFERKYLFLNLV